MTRVLVTGGNGFLGAHLCAGLSRAGKDVVAGVRSAGAEQRLSILAENVPSLRLDVESCPELIAETLQAERVDAIIHAAAYGVNFDQNNIVSAARVNVMGSLNLLLAAASAGVTKYVHVGTSSEYASCNSPIREDSPLSPVGTYGVTKRAASMVCTQAASELAIDFTVVRVFGMYGPLEGKHKFVPQIMTARESAEKLELTGGKQIRDYTYVGDVADAFVSLIDKPSIGRTSLILASGKPTTMRQLGDAAAAAMATTEELHWGRRPYRPGESMFVLGDPCCAANLLNWRATTSLEQGMAMTAAFEPFRGSL